MRFGFVTCVELGLAAMEGIYDAGGHLDLALTLKDDRAREKSGRVYIDDFCERHGTPLYKIDNINDHEALAILSEAVLDWLFIVGWSQIATKEVLETPRNGVLGMHPTLLPQGRGRAPIPWTIIKGLTETGVTTFMLDETVDSGPILDRQLIRMAPLEDASTLYAKVRQAHRALAAKAILSLQSYEAQFLPQDEDKATYWPKRAPEDGELLGTMAVDEAVLLVRALTCPYPGARVRRDDGQVMLVWSAEKTKEPPSIADAPVLRFVDGWLIVREYEILPGKR
jgi:methionyl-tRNA formyltransferase